MITEHGSFEGVMGSVIAANALVRRWNLLSQLGSGVRAWESHEDWSAGPAVSGSPLL